MCRVLSIRGIFTQKNQLIWIFKSRCHCRCRESLEDQLALPVILGIGSVIAPAQYILDNHIENHISQKKIPDGQMNNWNYTVDSLLKTILSLLQKVLLFLYQNLNTEKAKYMIYRYNEVKAIIIILLLFVI